jgi:toxin-antitoxin system PIN domain toxin
MKKNSDLVLLDINVLLALAWPNHQFHAPATRKLRIGQRWATCALTQLGFIRLSSNPAAIAGAVTPVQAASLLAQIVHDSYHVYLPMNSAPAELVDTFGRIFGHRQVTDIYLVSVAREHSARLLTFDARLQAVGEVEVLS